MNEYNEGDLVEAVKGESVVRGRIKIGTGLAVGYQYIGDSASLVHYEKGGWTVTLIEKAAPKLPTEPGLYIESGKAASYTNIWTRSSNGRWLSAAGSKFDGRAEEFAPFTRLEPVPVTAKKVIEFIADYMASESTAFDAAREEFGVTDV